MYLKFYGLREEPFGVTPDPRFLCATPTYQEAQATLEYGIRSGRGFTALIAKPGMGKTTLLFHLLERYSRVARTAFIFLTQCDSREFMRYLMSELGTDTGETDFVRLQEHFGQLLVREAQAGKKVIAVVDEAQNLDVTVLETVRLLSDFETPRAKLLHIILTGQPELADRLASPALLQLRQRISHLVRLDPLNAAEVNRYIDHRLRLAGYTGAPLFTAEARAVIAQRSEGIPRAINNLCFNALSLGCALQRRSIGAEILAEVSADLDFEGLRTQQEEAKEAASQRAAAPATAAVPSPQTAAEPAITNPVPEDTAEPSPQPVTEAAPALVAKAGNGEEPGRKISSPGATPAFPAAAPAEEVHAETAAGNGSQPEAPASLPLPGPMLVPDPTPLPPVACKTEEAAKTEVGNLALRIMPAEARDKPQMPVSGSGQAVPIAPQLSSMASAPPANGVATTAAAEKTKSAVDVEALAADCALFGMEGRRWKRPVGRTPTSPGPAAPRSTPAAAPLRANVPRPIKAQVPAPAGATPVKPTPVNGSTVVPATRPGEAGGRIAVKNGPGKLWPTRPVAAAINARKRRRQRSLLLAAGASLLLLLMLIWLLGTSAPNTSQAAEGNATEQNTSQPANTSPSDGAATLPSDSSVLDVVQELPKPGGADVRETPPAVVMRGTRAGEQMVRRVDPVYPAAAQANRIQGPVVLEATIGTHGFLRHIRVVSGDPLLADSVLDAVRGWRYRPHTEHGRPVETETRIVVNFQLRPVPSGSSQNP